VNFPASKLTDQQSKALEFIKNSVGKHGNAPTLRELCSFMGYSAIGSAQDVVAALRKKGYLQVPERQSARGLILAEKTISLGEDSREFDPNTFAIHCLGSVPAGNPLEAVEERIGTLRMSIMMFARPYPNRERLFAVRSSGQSMIEAGIHDGDWLVVLHESEGQEGDIVVARKGNDTTVKRLMKDKLGWYLKPENPVYPVIRASDDEPFEIVGKVIALQRTFKS
jgi:repressor LexA